MKIQVWKGVAGWAWCCRECVALDASRGVGYRFKSQPNALASAYGHIKRWH